MPDGTIIEGVPEGTSQADLQARLERYKKPEKSLLQRGGEALINAQPVVGAFKGMNQVSDLAAKGGYELGGYVTDLGTKLGMPPELAASYGYSANLGVQALPVLGSIPLTAGKMGSIAEKPARALMQSSMKPAMADLKSGAAGRAIGTALEEGFSPTSRGMGKASALAEKLNTAGQEAIKASPAKVNVESAISRLHGPYERAMTQVNPQADIKAITDAEAAFRGSPLIGGQSEIPVALANKIKSGTYTAIGNKAYGELSSASTEAQKQIARGLREEVISKVPEIAEPLKREAAIRNFMEVAAGRAAQDANKNPLSLGTSIAAIMHDPLAAAGMWANASTPVKAMLARMLFTGGKPEIALPAAIAAREAATQGDR